MSVRPVISSSHDHSYQPFAPMTILMWREVIGWDPILLLVEDEEAWSRTAFDRVMLEYLRQINADFRFIGKIEGYETAQQAQSSRQHVAALDLPEDDILMTADIDMFPLSKLWFHQHDATKWDFTLFYSNAYGNMNPPVSPPYHCTSYMAGTVKVWREIMGLKVTGEVASQLQSNFDKHLGRACDSWTAWNCDEVFFGSRIKAWDGYPDRCQMIPRYGGPPDDRVDRSNWPTTLSKTYLSSKVDAHCIRPPALAPNWKPLRELLSYYLDGKDMEFIDSFVSRYRKARYE